MAVLPPKFVSAIYTAVAADATANLVNIPTRLTDVELADAALQILVVRSAAFITLGASVVSKNDVPGDVRVTEGAGYAVTTGDIFHLQATTATRVGINV